MFGKFIAKGRRVGRVGYRAAKIRSKQTIPPADTDVAFKPVNWSEFKEYQEKVKNERKNQFIK